MKRKLVALAFSDHHAAAWKQHNKDGRRTALSCKLLKPIFEKANRHSIPVLNCGDLIDHPKRVDNIVLHNLSQAMRSLNTQLVGINGNHDIFRQSSYADTSPGYMNSLSYLHSHVYCVDNQTLITETLAIHGVPYFHGDVGFIEAVEERVNTIRDDKQNILLIHRDLAGAVEPTGEIIEKNHDQDRAMKSLFKEFDLVLSGHIHKAQKIKALGNNVYMLGATNQQRRSDAGTECGYWEIFDDNQVRFCPLDAPQFKYHKAGEQPGDDYNYWIELPPEIKSVDEIAEETHFDVNSDRKSMVKAYLKAKGIKDKSKRKTALKYLG